MQMFSVPNNRHIALICLLLVCAPVSVAHAQRYNADARDEPRNASIMPDNPVRMEELQEVGKESVLSSEGDGLSAAVAEEKDLALKIRRDSMREAALSYGARGGLAFRTKEIMEELEKSSPALDKVYNFRRLLIKAPSNMFIEPPIISEALNNFLVTPSGDEAAVSDAVYQIARQARIVSAPRDWRQYLERVWEKVTPPPNILIPENPAERKAWRVWVREGWYEGVAQANETFQADLNRLVADFEGQVRYRVLLTQNKVSVPYATLEDRGVSGNQEETMIGNRPVNVTTEMRVGDRAIRITQPVTLRMNETAENWAAPMQATP